MAETIRARLEKDSGCVDGFVFVTLDTLLALAHICKWDERTWFVDGRLTGQTLSLVTREHVGFVERCWGEQLRAVLPGLVERNVKASKRRQVYRGQVEAEQGRLVE
jgi:hypothetical protein